MAREQHFMSSRERTTIQLPSPRSTTNRCDRGQRSPLEPTEPWIGTRGTIPRLTIAWSVRTSSGRTPECPLRKAFRRMTMTARTTSGSYQLAGSSGSAEAPAPAEWLSRRFLWSCSSSSGATGMFLNSPKPVVTPYSKTGRTSSPRRKRSKSSL